MILMFLNIFFWQVFTLKWLLMLFNLFCFFAGFSNDRIFIFSYFFLLQVYPIHCSRCCSCFCCCCVNKLEASDFYNDEVTRLTQEFDKERDNALKTPLGIVFVTFKSVNMAKDVYDAFRRSMLECSFQPPVSSVSRLENVLV